MSAIRTNRTHARDGRFIAPYTRWFSRMFGLQSPKETEEQGTSSASREKDSTSLSTQVLTSEHQTSNQQAANHSHRPHLTPLQNSNASKTASPSTSSDIEMDNVVSLLSQSAGQSVSAEEVEGMLAILRANTPPEPREIFRFSSSTPTRDLQSPSTPLSTRKKLPRNPNGVYRWEGAGSAKHMRPRNRYASPVFGASPSKQGRSAMQNNIGSQDTPLPDSKRRRVGDESSTSSVSTQRPPISEPPARKLPFPSTASPPHVNGVANCPNPVPSPYRLRTPVKPTAPVVPSPLRQTWSEGSSTSSQNETGKSPSQTKTANFMAELIRETTPPKKPDLANPYQVASPVGKVGPPRRSIKRPRATGRPAAPSKAETEEGKRKKEETKERENLKEYSPQAIIEATVPKGSQRSRPPPAHFEKSADASIIEEASSHQGPRPQRETPVVVETKTVTYVVEEVADIDDDDDDKACRSVKRTKSSNIGRGPTTSTSPTNPISPTVSLSKLSSAPKEPSKLRYSFRPPAPSSPAPKTTALPAPSGFQKSEFKFEPPSSNFSFFCKPTELSPGGSTKPQEQAKKVDTINEDMKAKARAMTAGSLPTFVITSSATSVFPSSATLAEMHRRVKGLPVSSLPSFELSTGPPKSTTPFSFEFDPANPKPRPSFTFGPATNRSPKPPGMFTFGINSTPTPATLEATIIKPFVPSSAPVIKAFDFAAAGMKAPCSDPGTWICSLCGLSNPNAALKCQTCDTPTASTSSSVTVTVPPAPPPSVPAIKAFDFAAAGMQAPSVTPGMWICTLCALKNPMSATQCDTCETPRTFFS